MPSTILRRGGALSLVAALLTTLTLTACGGDSSSNDTGTSSATSPASSGGATMSTGESGGNGGNAGNADGAKIFASAGCASCHALKAADSNGQVGPNLDDLKPDEATVEHQVINGGGGMPAFKDSLDPAEIKAVSAYVADNAGK